MNKTIFIFIAGALLFEVSIWFGSYLIAHVGPDYQFAAITTTFLFGLLGIGVVIWAINAYMEKPR